MTEQEIKYAAEQHLSGKPMTVIAKEMNYSSGTLWEALRKSGIEYKRRSVHRQQTYTHSEEYYAGYKAGYVRGRAERMREETNV